MRGRTGKWSFCVHVSCASMIESIHAGQLITHVSSASMIESIHAGQDPHVHVSRASMIESIHAGQDPNVHVPSASMIESTHAGQDNNVHVSSASMIESIHAGQDITFMSLVHPCSRKLSTNLSIFGKFHNLPNKPYKATTPCFYSVFAFS